MGGEFFCAGFPGSFHSFGEKRIMNHRSRIVCILLLYYFIIRIWIVNNQNQTRIQTQTTTISKIQDSDNHLLYNFDSDDEDYNYYELDEDRSENWKTIVDMNEDDKTDIYF